MRGRWLVLSLILIVLAGFAPAVGAQTAGDTDHANLLAEDPNEFARAIWEIAGRYTVETLISVEGSPGLAGFEPGTDGLVVANAWEMLVDLGIDPAVYPPREEAALVDAFVFGSSEPKERAMNAVVGSVSGRGAVRAETDLGDFGGVICTAYDVGWTIGDVRDGRFVLSPFGRSVIVGLDIRGMAEVRVSITQGSCDVTGGTEFGSGTGTVPFTVRIGGRYGYGGNWDPDALRRDTRLAIVSFEAGQVDLGDGVADLEAFLLRFGPPSTPPNSPRPTFCTPGEEGERVLCRSVLNDLARSWGLDPGVFDAVSLDVPFPRDFADFTSNGPPGAFGDRLRVAAVLATATLRDGSPAVPAFHRLRAVIVPLAAASVTQREFVARAKAFYALSLIMDLAMAEVAADA